MKTELIFPGVIPGNNGRGGLLRTHYAQRAKWKKNWIWHIKASTKNRHLGPVRLELIRHSINPRMDYDNLVSTGKILIDAIVKAGVLSDDAERIIAERQYTQTRALNAQNQMTVILITDLVEFQPLKQPP